jgi:hypothetical protein
MKTERRINRNINPHWHNVLACWCIRWSTDFEFALYYFKYLKPSCNIDRRDFGLERKLAQMFKIVLLQIRIVLLEHYGTRSKSGNFAVIYAGGHTKL